MRKDTIPPNWTDLVQLVSQSVAPDNIGIGDTCLTPDIEEDTRKSPSHEPSVAPENNYKIPTSPKS